MQAGTETGHAGRLPDGPEVVTNPAMSESFLSPAILGILAGCAIPIVAIVGGFWSKTVSDKSKNELKRAMVERGMTADEIERVLHADGSR